MKQLKTYFIGLLSAFALTACTHQEVPLYDEANGGVYFNVAAQQPLHDTINFATQVVGNPTELPVHLNLKLMGYKVDTERKVVLKTKPLDGYPMAQVVCPEVVFSPDSIVQGVTVMAQRPTSLDSVYAAVVYIDHDDPENQIGKGVKGAQQYTLFVKEAYAQPRAWSERFELAMYFGRWSVQKHILLANIAKRNDFYNSNDYRQLISWNAAAIDSLRKIQAAHPDTVLTVDIPFTIDNPAGYPKPAYWGEAQTTYLGAYSNRAFVTICNELNITTANERSAFSEDDGNLERLNQQAVRAMMQRYNQFYYDGWRQGSSYRGEFYIPMLDLDYAVIRPAAWGDNQGGRRLIEQYYGEYSDAKYKFMIEVWRRRKGSSFVLNQLVPVMNEWGNVRWDSSLGGENAIRNMSRIFKAEAESSGQPFTFPNV